LRERIHSVAPALPLDRIQTLDDALAAGRSIARFNTLLASSFGILALVLSMIGVYGLTSREVANRRRESGVRIALGANPAAVLLELTRPIARLTMVGVIGGAAVAIAAASSMRALLHGVAPIDPPTFLLVPLSIVLVAAAAVLAAAWPILRTDAVSALRN
jgi:ABC-type antimicrobial peptide transport system permease subunit